MRSNVASPQTDRGRPNGLRADGRSIGSSVSPSPDLQIVKPRASSSHRNPGVSRLGDPILPADVKSIGSCSRRNLRIFHVRRRGIFRPSSAGALFRHLNIGLRSHGPLWKDMIRSERHASTYKVQDDVFHYPERLERTALRTENEMVDRLTHPPLPTAGAASIVVGRPRPRLAVAKFPGRRSPANGWIICRGANGRALNDARLLDLSQAIESRNGFLMCDG